MTKSEFRARRGAMGKTQKQLSTLLGVSLRAVHSFEQGWRKVPMHVERQMLLLAMLARRASKAASAPCWKIKKCPADVREQCPAWEFKAGHICWFINGTMCEGRSCRSWGDKVRLCRTCKVFEAAVGPVPEEK